MGSRTSASNLVGQRLAAVLFVLALALGAGTVPQAKAGTITGQTVSGLAYPASQSTTIRGPASLHLSLDASSSGSVPFPVLSEAVVSLDDDFLIDTSVVPQCDPAAIATLTTAAALAACPNSKIGGGSMTLLTTPTAIPDWVVTVFNATPSGGQPRIALHAREGSVLNTTAVLVGVLGTSGLPGYGQQIQFSLPLFAAAFGYGRVAFDIDKIEPTPGSPYFSARCPGTNHAWSFDAAFTYYDTSTRADTDSQLCNLHLNLGKLKKFKRKGFVRIPVEAPGPGVVKLVQTKQVKGQKKDVGATGEVLLKVRARGDAARKLAETGKVKVKAEISFVPSASAGAANSGKLVTSKALTLVRQR